MPEGSLEIPEIKINALIELPYFQNFNHSNVSLQKVMPYVIFIVTEEKHFHFSHSYPFLVFSKLWEKGGSCMPYTHKKNIQICVDTVTLSRDQGKLKEQHICLMAMRKCPTLTLTVHPTNNQIITKLPLTSSLEAQATFLYFSIAEQYWNKKQTDRWNGVIRAGF